MRRATRGVVVDFAELSDAGRDPDKQINEDASGYAETRLGHLAVVCDGMGGHLGGQEASATAVRTLLDHVAKAPEDVAPGPVLKQGIELAAAAVYEVGGDAPADARPGATCVAVLVHDAGAEIAHVGDSRLYRVRGSTIVQVTQDHSVVQEMVNAGVLTPEQAVDHPEANQITRALGTHEHVEVELRDPPLDLRPGDTLVLTSDGLTDLVEADEICSEVTTHLAAGPAVACQVLVDLANRRGGHDNITAQVMTLVEVPSEAAFAGSARTARGTLVVDDGQAPVPAPTVGIDGVPATQRGNFPPPTVNEPAETIIGDEVEGPPPTQLLDAPPGLPTSSNNALPSGPTVVATPPTAAPPSRAHLPLKKLAIGAGVSVVVIVLMIWAIRASRSADEVNEATAPPPPPTQSENGVSIPPAAAPSAELVPETDPEETPSATVSVPSATAPAPSGSAPAPSL